MVLQGQQQVLLLVGVVGVLRLLAWVQHHRQHQQQ
jgi:hypothetical protein